ncbi:MAG: TraR/DksA C4-type zinc finger protein [Flavobacteriales bacterium]|nr:TraR/DksA C4-type zinc finger protein [Flavobacteriales bacterium]
MNEKEKKEFKKKLNEVFKETESRIEDLKELTKPIAPENAIGRISRMDAINNKSVNEAALRQAEFKMSNLKIAFDKVDKEGFGNCIRCGQTIPMGRLMLLPGSSKCVRCAS